MSRTIPKNPEPYQTTKNPRNHETAKSKKYQKSARRPDSRNSGKITPKNIT
jgi:hypothetical protein